MITAPLQGFGSITWGEPWPAARAILRRPYRRRSIRTNDKTASCAKQNILVCLVNKRVLSRILWVGVGARPRLFALAWRFGECLMFGQRGAQRMSEEKLGGAKKCLSVGRTWMNRNYDMNQS